MSGMYKRHKKSKGRPHKCLYFLRYSISYVPVPKRLWNTYQHPVDLVQPYKAINFDRNIELNWWCNKMEIKKKTRTENVILIGCRIGCRDTNSNSSSKNSLCFLIRSDGKWLPYYIMTNKERNKSWLVHLYDGSIDLHPSIILNM